MTKAPETFFERNEKVVRELTVLAISLAALYSNVISSFLAVFVPQNCPTTVYTGGNGKFTNATVVNTECTFQQNVYIDISPYNAFTLIVNLVTCIALIVGFYIEWRRDMFIIEHFDVDESKGDDDLKLQLDVPTPTHDHLRVTLASYNRLYRNYFIWLAILFIVNVAVSGVLVFHYYYADYRTATTFLTSLSLVSARLYSALYVAFDCLSGEKAESNNLNVPLAFNIVKDEGEASPSHPPSTQAMRHRERVVKAAMESTQTTTLSAFAPRPSMRSILSPLRTQQSPPPYPHRQGRHRGTDV